jgi:hypothetical protein
MRSSPWKCHTRLFIASLYCTLYKCRSIVQLNVGTAGDSFTAILNTLFISVPLPILLSKLPVTISLFIHKWIRAYFSFTNTPWAICCVFPPSSYNGALRHSSLALMLKPLLPVPGYWQWRCLIHWLLGTQFDCFVSLRIHGYNLGVAASAIKPNGENCITRSFMICSLRQV